MSAARLAAWLSAHGGHHDGLEVREEPSGRRVIAARDLAADACVARVPRRLLLTVEMARASSIGRQLRAAGIELSSTHALLAAWLAIVATRGGELAPYTDSLPRQLTGFPLLAAPEVRALLAGTLAGAMTDELEVDLATDYAGLQAVHLGRAIDRATFTWARLCVGSRAFALTIDGITTSALVPFADLLDHASDAATSWGFDDAADAFTMVTRRPIAAGEVVTDSYGDKSSARLLAQFGFCLPDGCADEVILCGHRVGAAHDDDRGRAMIDELTAARGGDRAAAMTTVRATAAAVMAHIAGSPEDDAALLATATDPTVTACVWARRAERRVLAAWATPLGP